MPYAIHILETGGPEVMRAVDVPEELPGPGQISINQTAIGLNFIDVYHRSGLYPVNLPTAIGMEAAGSIDKIGDGVTKFSVGDRVAYAGGGLGAYTNKRIISADAVVKIPNNVTDETAAAIMLKGFTASYLLHRTHPIKEGDIVLFHAIAGGVGLIACQILKQLGAIVVGTVGNKEKAELARKYGCDYPIVYTEESFKNAVMDITDGLGVPVVYDSVGASTFDESIDCLAKFGTFVSFGNASGPVLPFEPGLLSQKGSLFFTRPTLMSHIGTPNLVTELAGWLFGHIDNGLEVEIKQTFALKKVADAHRALESRNTTGSTILIP